MNTIQSPPESAQAARLTRTVRERHQQRRLPNLPLIDQHGRTVYFYDDVMKGRQVLLGSMYTGCTNICTPATQNLIAARKLLGAQGLQLQFVSMTLTPLNDPPEALQAYIKQHGIDTPWTFLTGKVAHLETIQRVLGFLGTRDGDDLLSHAAAALYCDERNLRWSHVNTLLSPQAIARMVRFAMA